LDKAKKATYITVLVLLAIPAFLAILLASIIKNLVSLSASYFNILCGTDASNPATSSYGQFNKKVPLYFKALTISNYLTKFVLVH